VQSPPIDPEISVIEMMNGSNAEADMGELKQNMSRVLEEDE
jgi:hypothetical protein